MSVIEKLGDDVFRAPRHLCTVGRTIWTLSEVEQEAVERAIDVGPGRQVLEVLQSEAGAEFSLSALVKHRNRYCKCPR